VTGVMSKLGLMVHQAAGLVIKEESELKKRVTGVMLKLGLMVHQAAGLVIREESDWHNVKQPKVAMHRSCHLF